MLVRLKVIVLMIFFCSLIISTSSVLAEKNVSEPLVDSAAVLLKDGEVEVTVADVTMMFKDMTLAQKQKLLGQIDNLEKLLYDDIVLKKRAREAVRKQLENDPLVQWKLENARRNVLSEALERDWRKTLQLSQDFGALAREYYDAHPEEFKVKEKIKVAHILFSVDVENKQQVDEQRLKATEILEQIKKGDLDFSKAAKQYSGDKSNAASGGELNFFTRGRMVKPFEEAAFALSSTGELSEVVQTRFGFHLIKLLDRQPASVLPYEHVEERLVKMQKEKFIAVERKKYLDSFDVDQNTTVYMRVLQGVYDALKNQVADE